MTSSRSIEAIYEKRNRWRFQSSLECCQSAKWDNIALLSPCLKLFPNVEWQSLDEIDTKGDTG